MLHAHTLRHTQTGAFRYRASQHLHWLTLSVVAASASYTNPEIKDVGAAAEKAGTRFLAPAALFPVSRRGCTVINLSSQNNTTPATEIFIILLNISWCVCVRVCSGDRRWEGGVVGGVGVGGHSVQYGTLMGVPAVS